MTTGGFMLTKIKFIIRGLFGFFEDLEKAPKIILSSEVVGKTAGGMDINAFKAGSGQKNILFLGGLHGNETGCIKLVSKLANFLKNNLPEGITVYFIPVLNKDGYSKALKNPDYLNGGSVGRTNANNVDLNRNFDTKDWEKDGIWEFGNKKIKVSGGAKPFSEPETKSLIEFVKKENIIAIFDFHNRAGTVLGSKDGTGKKLAEIYSKHSGYRNITDSEWQNTGWSKNYFEENGITYLEIESSKRWGSDIDKNKEAVVASINCLL